MARDPAAAIYSLALFEAAQEAGRLDAVQRDLNDLGNALAGTPELAQVLFNPAFPAPGKKAILARATSEADELVGRALLVLVDNGRLDELPGIIEDFNERHQEVAGELEVELTTAIPIDDEEADGLRGRLAEATGKTVTLTRRVDAEILGGVVLRMRDLLIDASVRGRLDALRLSLRSARLAGSATGGEG